MTRRLETRLDKLEQGASAAQVGRVYVWTALPDELYHCEELGATVTKAEMDASYLGFQIAVHHGGA